MSLLLRLRASEIETRSESARLRADLQDSQYKIQHLERELAERRLRSSDIDKIVVQVNNYDKY